MAKVIPVCLSFARLGLFCASFGQNETRHHVSCPRSRDAFSSDHLVGRAKSAMPLADDEASAATAWQGCCLACFFAHGKVFLLIWAYGGDSCECRTPYAFPDNRSIGNGNGQSKQTFDNLDNYERGTLYFTVMNVKWS